MVQVCTAIASGPDLGWGTGGQRPRTNAGPPTKPFNTRTYRSILDYSELSNPTQCVLTGAGSPLCPPLNFTFTYKVELVTFRLVIR